MPRTHDHVEILLSITLPPALPFSAAALMSADDFRRVFNKAGFSSVKSSASRRPTTTKEPEPVAQLMM